MLVWFREQEDGWAERFLISKTAAHAAVSPQGGFANGAGAASPHTKLLPSPLPLFPFPPTLPSVSAQTE